MTPKQFQERSVLKKQNLEQTGVQKVTDEVPRVREVRFLKICVSNTLYHNLGSQEISRHDPISVSGLPIKRWGAHMSRWRQNFF